MSREDEVREFSSKEAEKEKRREKKRRPKMQISGRGVIELARIIQKRAKNP